MGHSFYNAPVNRVQIKYLSGDVSSDGTVTDLTFSNLTINKWYTITLQASFLSSDTYGQIYVTHNGVIQCGIYGKSPALGNGDRHKATATRTFKASATTVTVVVDVDTNTLEGDGGGNETWAQLEERNDLIETSAW